MKLSSLPILAATGLHPFQEQGHPAQGHGGLHLSDVFVIPTISEMVDGVGRDGFDGNDDRQLKEIFGIRHYRQSRKEWEDIRGEKRKLMYNDVDSMDVYNITEGMTFDEDHTLNLMSERELVRLSAALNWKMYPFEYDDYFDEGNNQPKWFGKVMENDKGFYGTNAKGDDANARAENEEKWTMEQHLFQDQKLANDPDWTYNEKHVPESLFNSGSYEAVGIAFCVYEDKLENKYVIFRVIVSANIMLF